MKNIFFLLSIFLCVNLTVAQCTESASGFGNNVNIPSYNVLGDISIVYDTDQITFKTASNYSTDSGPDVRVYLVNSGGRTDQQLINTNPESLPNIPFGLVGFSGEQEITVNVPTSVNLSDYDTVFFYCLQFTQFWDFGKISPIDVSSCNLSTDTLQKADNFSISPNPTKGALNLEGTIDKLLSYELYDAQGVLVVSSDVVTEQLNFDGLPSGVYSLVLLSAVSYDVEKIIIE